jgi:hypothetical protein
MLVVLEDLLRCLVHTQRGLSPVGAAALQRMALEIRCNFLFITKGPDPKKYADLYARYADVERVLHDQFNGPDDPPMLRSGEEASIRARCPEWFTNASGKVGVMHWTADASLKSLKALSKRVCLENEYHQLYGSSSMFVHGSSQLRNVYQHPVKGIGSLATPTTCTQMTLITTMHCMKTLEVAVDYFGVPSFEPDHINWGLMWLDAIGRPMTMPPSSP